MAKRVIQIIVYFPKPIFLMIYGTTGRNTKMPNAKQNSANPISESLSFNFSFTYGMYKTHVPIMIFNDANTQVTEKYFCLNKINLSEFI